MSTVLKTTETSSNYAWFKTHGFLPLALKVSPHEAHT